MAQRKFSTVLPPLERAEVQRLIRQWAVAGTAGATGPAGPAGSDAAATTNAGDLVSGTLADARLSSKVPLRDVNEAIAGLWTFAQGIKFPATQVPNADANGLDDYEKGQWTPNDASGAALVLAFAAGVYLKIGDGVLVSGQVVYPGTADATPSVIGGLPFTVGPVNGPLATGFRAGAAVDFGIYVVNSTTLLKAAIIGTGAQPTNAQMSNSNTVFGGFYLV